MQRADTAASFAFAEWISLCAAAGRVQFNLTALSSIKHCNYLPFKEVDSV